MIVVIDNYDSFTYNLVQYMGEVSGRANEIHVVRNDQISVEDVISMQPKQIIISPGPCTPNEAGISVELVRQLSGRVPILGVCLGHQAIGQAFGGRVVRAKRVLHGKTSRVTHNGKGIFKELEQHFCATRYHSLLVEHDTLPSCLEILAWSEDEPTEIMAFRHQSHRFTIGVQFHPESILTAVGKELLFRFLNLHIDEDTIAPCTTRLSV